MSCHAHAELRAANKQCVKLPSRVIKACHFRQSQHKFRRVCGWLQPVTYEENQVPRLPRRSGAASRASRRRLNPAQGRHPGPSVPRLPRKTTVDVRLCHACHVKSRWMSPSATPATQKWRGVTGVTAAPKPGPRAPPSAICPTPATQNDGRCEVVPRLPREIKVDVTKCHACHAEVARRHGRHGGA